MAMIDDIYAVKLEDNKLIIEVEKGCGINLDVILDYYEFKNLKAIV